MIEILKSLSDTKKTAQALALKVKNGGVICFTGDLGSGKTTMIKFICEGLGIEISKVKSPTYTYIRKYELKDRNIYHIDLYRLDSIDDIMARELTEIWNNKKNIVLIEWAEKIDELIDVKKTRVNLSYVNENSRKISF
ncbi:MAG: tRNA (adenosine(37)-N6)-threonylcarbamoyltransferase complex ATPase subunit type 1 TsaE [Candidatus Gracilibacteria bacterium]|jgi:tRNA threonylcarbamoyladenosine biosynthesis protein TsaE